MRVSSSSAFTAVPTSPVVPANPFVLSVSASSVSSPIASAAPAHVAASTAVATTADVSAGSFDGVSESDQIAAIRRLYTVVNPDKMNQVRVAGIGFVAFAPSIVKCTCLSPSCLLLSV